MPDRCDNCTFYRLRVYGPKSVGECRYKDPFAEGSMGYWAQVKPDDWCGQYKAIGSEVAATYLRGSVHLVDMTPQLVLDGGGDPVFSVTALAGYQITNETGNTRTLAFTEDQPGTKLLCQLGCGANQTTIGTLFPPIASMSGQVWVTLTKVAEVYVSVQGRKVKP